MNAKNRRSHKHDGKKTYPTLEAAQQAAAIVAKKKDKQGNPIVTYLRAYGCHCGGFHFGKSKEIDWSKVK